MNKLSSFFKNKIFLLSLILFFSVLIIYFCFPYIMIAQFSPFDNIVVRIILIIICIIYAIFYYFKKLRPIEEKPVFIPAKTNENNSNININGNKKTLAQFQTQVEENLKILKFSRSDKNENLYNLPWYLVIGPNDSGKTSTLLNSKILVSLKDKFTRSPLDKTVPTKFCEWWFSNDAVFIDTEGGFLSPSYEKNWEYLLQSIQEARPQKPLNGVIICYSITDLIHQDEHEFSNQAWNIKKRLQEMSASFGVKDLPVYIVFSKIDLLTGFNEYFQNFDKNKLDQILGISFLQKNKVSGNTSINSFKQEFDLLANSLRKMCFGLLQTERNEFKRGFIVEFPEEFASLKEKIHSFLAEIFSKNRFEDISFLRGVYFTSSGSIGMPIDPLGMETTFPYPFQYDPFQNKNQTRENEAYFIKKLFSEVILPDKEIAAPNLYFKKKAFIVRKFSYIGAIAIVILMTILWGVSYFSNKSYLLSLDAELSKYSPNHFAQLLSSNNNFDPSAPTTLRLLQGLQELSGIPGGYDDKRLDASTDFLLKGLGLYQGDKLNAAAENIYLKSLQQYFVPYLKKILEIQLTTKTDNLLDLYQTLQTYLMLNDATHLDTDDVASWFDTYWQESFTNQQNKKYLLEQLTKNLKVVLSEGLYQSQLNTNLIEQSRVLLKQLPDEVFLFENIKRTHLKFIPDFHLTSLQEQKEKVAFERSNDSPLNIIIPATYTKLGYMNFFYTERLKYFGKSAFDEKNWILGETQGISTPIQFVRDSNEIYNKVKKLYLEEYIKIWGSYINTLTIKNMSNLQESINATGILAGEASPIRFILSAVEENTTLSPSLNTLASKNSPLLKDKMNSMGEDNPVDVTFSSLNQLFKKDETSGKIPLDDILALFAEIHGALLNLQQNNSSSSASIPKELEMKILTLSAQTPAPVNNWLTSIVSYAGNISKKQAAKNLDALWQKILPQCVQFTQNKYPFCAHCAASVSISDFSKLFGYTGIIDNFLKANLADYASTDVYPWQWKGDSKNFSSGIKQLEAASRIRDSFFQAGSQNLQLNFSIKPVFLDSSVLTEHLSTSGQAFDYAHGPERAMQFAWPNASGSTATSIIFNIGNGQEPLQLTTSGFWSIFQLLQQSHVSMNPNTGSTSFSVTIGGKQASFDIYPTQGGNNPFSKPSIFDFRCPSHI